MILYSDINISSITKVSLKPFVSKGETLYFYM
jgi:hypothetical protein